MNQSGADSPECAEPVNLARIQDLADGDREFEIEMYTMFLEDSAGRVAALSRHIEKGDADSLLREAHTIKGAAANVGTTKLHLIAAKLEKLDLASDPDGAVRLSNEISHEFERVRVFLSAHIAS